jgi:hypothetical protein
MSKYDCVHYFTFLYTVFNRVDFVEDFASHTSAEVNAATAAATTTAETVAAVLKCNATSSQDCSKVDESVLNENKVDFPPCKEKQRKALSAVSVLSA